MKSYVKAYKNIWWRANDWMDIMSSNGKAHDWETNEQINVIYKVTKIRMQSCSGAALVVRLGIE